MKRERKKTAELLEHNDGNASRKFRDGSRISHHLGSVLKNAVFSKITPDELNVLATLELARPESLRAFDQIPMQGTDLLCQVKLVAPQLANKDVVFIGDHDGTSLLIGLLHAKGLIKAPARMTLLDFDERLLKQARLLASKYGFDDIFEAQPYNVFHPVPADLKGKFDVFYTNSPYGKATWVKVPGSL